MRAQQAICCKPRDLFACRRMSPLRERSPCRFRITEPRPRARRNTISQGWDLERPVRGEFHLSEIPQLGPRSAGPMSPMAGQLAHPRVPALLQRPSCPCSAERASAGNDTEGGRIWRKSPVVSLAAGLSWSLSNADGGVRCVHRACRRWVRCGDVSTDGIRSCPRVASEPAWHPHGE
jgi:hypothetical protein